MWCKRTVKLCLIPCLHIIFRVFLGKMSYNHHCCKHSPNPVLNVLILCIWSQDFNFGVAVLILKRCNIQPTGPCIWAHITVLTHGKQRLICCCVSKSVSLFRVKQYFQQFSLPRCHLSAQSEFLVQWNFLGQTATSRCGGFLTFREITPSPSSECDQTTRTLRRWRQS